MASQKSKEYLVEHLILTYLSELDIGFFWKNTSSGFFDGQRFRKHKSPFAINGTSDILGILNGGRLIALEVKDKGEATDEQKAFIKKVQALGGLGAVVRSVDQTRQVLQEWGLIS
jgi:hypothetical protein